MSVFASRMKSERKRKNPNLSMKVASDLIDLPHDAIRRYESGESEPTISTLKKIVDYYGCSADYLIGRTDYRGR